jgi:hypothetical protein
MVAGGMNRKQKKQLARRLHSANPGWEVVHPRAAGIDVGHSAHYVAVRPDQDPEPCAAWNALPRICIGWRTGWRRVE